MPGRDVAARLVRVDDFEQEKRWPRYTSRALELGLRSLLSFQLFTEGRNLGALNLYSDRPHVFDHDDAERTGLLFAAHAAVALRGAQRAKQLTEAVRRHDVIGQAKGTLMERHEVTSDQAFGLLVRSSQNSQVQLRDVAEFLVRSSEDAAAAD